MQVGIIGINHKSANLKLREELAKTCHKLLNYFQFNLTDHPLIILSTCNRTEIYFSSENLAALHSYLLTLLRQDIQDEFDQKLYSFFGTDCFLHLVKVASGLDSAILGETEILGQVKVAYEMALQSHHLSKDLHFIFQKSLAIAKKVRTNFQLGRGMPDIEHAIFHTGMNYFSIGVPPRVLFIGASDINQKILSFLNKKNLFEISLCNRTYSKAQVVGNKQKVNLLEWSNLKEWVNYDWIIFGTKSPEYLVTGEQIDSIALGKRKLLMDLSVPRNVDPKIANCSQITLLNIDEINHTLKASRLGLMEIVVEAENKIIRNVHQHVLKYLEKEQTKLFDIQFSA